MLIKLDEAIAAVEAETKTWKAWPEAGAARRKIIKALYQGPLPIGDTVLDCVILDDPENTRVISMTSVFRAFGRVPRSNNRVINIPAFIDAQNLQKYIDQELMGLIKPIEYLDGKNTQTGYNALILPAICELYLKARREKELDKLNITDKGKRKARFHQWLSDEGRTILTRQFGKVEGIMEMCDDIEHFKTIARRQKTITVAPYLFDEMNRIIDH